MNQETFLYNNMITLLKAEFPKAKQSTLSRAAEKARKHFLSGAQFRGRAFDECYKVAVKEFKALQKAGL